MKAKIQIHRNSKPRKSSKPSKPRKAGEKPWQPRKLTPVENSRAIDFHIAKIKEIVEAYSGAVFKAWKKLDHVMHPYRNAENIAIHLAQIERIAKEAVKCK